MRKKSYIRKQSFQKTIAQERRTQLSQNLQPNIIRYSNNQNKYSNGINNLQQQLRQALEQVSNTNFQANQKRRSVVSLKQKYCSLKEENIIIKRQFEQLKHDFLKFKKRQEKSKTKQRQLICQKCKKIQENQEQIQRERQVYSKEKNTLKNQIKRLQSAIQENSSQAQFARIKNYADSIKKERQYLMLTIQDQKKLIDMLDQRISAYELQNLQVLGNVELLQQKMQELKMQNTLLKGFSRKQKSPARRKTGSIKTLDRHSQLATQQKDSLIS